MKVKQLKDLLETLDPELDVLGYDYPSYSFSSVIFKPSFGVMLNEEGITKTSIIKETEYNRLCAGGELPFGFLRAIKFVAVGFDNMPTSDNFVN